MTATTGETTARVMPWVLRGYVALLCVAAAATALAVRDWHDGVHTPASVVMVLVVAFAVAEVFVVHVAVRRNTHTFSLVEIPLVLALVLASPAVVVLARLTGAAVALAAHRRQRTTKLLFNLASFTLQDVAAIAILRWLGDGAIDHHRTWMALMAACLAASAIGFVLVLAAMKLSGGGHPAARELVGSATFAAASTVITTAAGIATALLWVADGFAALLLAPAIVGIHYALRSHVVRQTERRRLEAVEQTTALLEPSHTPDEAIGELLSRARAIFGVERASYVHLAGGLAVISRTTAPDGSIVERHEPAEHWQALLDLVPPGRHGAVIAPARGRAVSRTTTATSPRDGMIAAVTIGGQVVGHLVVTDRLSEVGRFDDDSLLVLQLMAREVALAVAEQVSDGVDDFHLLEAELNHRVRRDALTGLVNDIGLRDRLAAELSHAGLQRVAVVVVRVSPADRPGEPVEEGLVLVASQRLRSCVRGRDTVARPSDDEFAVIAATPGGERDAMVLAQRIVATLSSTVNVDGSEHRLVVDVGVCLRGVLSDPEAILARAGSACRSAGDAPRHIVVTNA